MKDKKKWVIGILCTLVCIMAVGYAVLAQQLNITGTTSIDSTWKVEITNIGEKEVVGKAVSKVTPSYTSTTANFSVGLTRPGDSITYDIEISNLGTLKAKVDSINVIMDENDAIKYTTSGVSNGDKLGVGEKTTLTIKVEYDSNVTSQPAVTTKDITVIVNYVHDSEGNATATYPTYSIGDVVTFAGSNWYVIKNSTSEEDYVTLLKEKVLTNAELGEYAVNDKYDTMAYYWSDTCHGVGTYGYTDYDDSGFNGHNDYEGSKVKEYLEGTYINTLGSENLKEVKGYKVRVITLEELQKNLGYSTEITASWYNYDQDMSPTWVYQNFGETLNSLGALSGYWTMDKYNEITDLVAYVDSDGRVGSSSVLGSSNLNGKLCGGVRPVINLLKSKV